MNEKISGLAASKAAHAFASSPFDYALKETSPFLEALHGPSMQKERGIKIIGTKRVNYDIFPIRHLITGSLNRKSLAAIRFAQFFFFRFRTRPRTFYRVSERCAKPRISGSGHEFWGARGTSFDFSGQIWPRILIFFIFKHPYKRKALKKDLFASFL